MAKYYGVKNGKIPGVYDSWDECKEQVHGYSNAVYKSFNDKDQAMEFVYGQNEVKKELYEVSAFVDGSYDSESGIFAWGVVFIDKDNQEEFSGWANNDYSKYRNVAGEIYGCVKAVSLALERNYKEIAIYHDYSGLRHWALGEWKRNNPLTEKYYDYMQKALVDINIIFIKVKSHSGNELNELADKLAKEALKGGKND